MSKIKSRKIANVKVLIGMVLAASLIAVFACEQKQTIKAEVTPEEKTETISFQGQPLKVSGDSAVIENLKSLISTEKMVIPPPPPPPAPGSEALTFDKDVFTVVDEMPEYPGGVVALRNFLAQTVKYPQEAIKNGIQGKVYVNFVVEKDGSVGAVKIARGVSPELDAEALRVVKLLTNWKPGRQKGEDVRVSYTVPIKFALQ
jgi:TonB family protein